GHYVLSQSGEKSIYLLWKAAVLEGRERLERPTPRRIQLRFEVASLRLLVRRKRQTSGGVEEEAEVVHVPQRSKGIEHRSSEVRLAAPATAAEQLLADALACAEAIVLSAASETEMFSITMDPAAVVGCEVSARFASGLVESEERGAIECEADAAK